MKYEKVLNMSNEELNHYNALLELDLDESLPYYNKHDIERLGAKTDDYIGIATIEFENGNYITIDIASGNSNYYDNIVLYSECGEELYVLDCFYKLDSFEFDFEDCTYIVKIERF